MAAFIAHHQRDNEDLVGERPGLNHAYAHHAGLIAAYDLADAVGTLGLLGCAWGLHTRQTRATELRHVVSLIQLSKAYLEMRDLGHWTCLKVHLGDALGRRYQRQLNRTIGGVETVILAVSQTACGAGVYQAASHRTCLAVMAVGCGWAFVVKIDFLRMAASRRDVPAAAAMAAPAPAAAPNRLLKFTPSWQHLRTCWPSSPTTAAMRPPCYSAKLA